MIVKAYIDESGVGGEEYCTVAAFVGKLGRWHEFDKRWKKLLKESKDNPSYAHWIEMNRKTGPFANWNSNDISLFYKKGISLIEKYAEFGVSTTVSAADYAEYRRMFGGKGTPDSIYGVGVRLVLDFICHHFRENSTIPNPCVSVVFDRGPRAAEAAAIFDEMKLGYDDAARILGDRAVGSTRDHCGLQIVDYFVSQARRSESRADISEVRRVAKPEDQAERVKRKPAPFFHVTNQVEMLRVMIEEKPRLKSRLKHRKRSQ